jgi:glutamate synthase domain-containing protein 2/glutamate synthase domain-containing protein 1/glutamate synthase domain-containing protein 3
MPAGQLRPIDVPLYDPRHDHDACGVGFVADLRGRHAGRTVAMALAALASLAHRGARAADDQTGDGAGLSLPLSPLLLGRICEEAGVDPDGRPTAVAMCFLPTAAAKCAAARTTVADFVADTGLTLAGWRPVPVRRELVAGRRLGETPDVWQAVILGDRRLTPLAFARRLALARRRIERIGAASGHDQVEIASMSAATVVYKGLFVGDELGRFYDDLRATDLDVPYALFHQRYSTNTFPSWRLAQPFRYLAHNGEINTVRGNREAMRGRRNALGGGSWARHLAAAGPLVSEDGSDSLSLDEALELLLLAGEPIHTALRELVPSAPGLGGADERWEERRSEPWDGPAALVFADGRRVGCLLDRNGLRPLAAALTDDGLVAVSSEAGSIPLDPERIVTRHRLGPGEMLVLDLESGTVEGPGIGIGAKEMAPPPAARVVEASPIALPRPPTDDRLRVALGLDAEVVKQIVRPMATDAKEAIWSMGDDTPIAALGRRPRRVSAFLRQSFAQVTNPAIDPERERAVMSLALAVGRQPAYFDPGRTAGAVTIPGPVLDLEEWTGLLGTIGAARTVTLDATWSVRRGPAGLATALHRLARRARSAGRQGTHLLVLTDRRLGNDRAAIPPILAVGAVHQALIGSGRRSRTDIAVETGECFDVHDVAMLLACGASAIHPWLLLELAAEVAGSRGAEELEAAAAVRNLRKALEFGLRKVLARMGISTLASYRGGQLFDVLGLAAELTDRSFPAAGGWRGTVGTDAIARAILARHEAAFGTDAPALEDPGLIRFRGTGEVHAFGPKVVKALQRVAEAAPDEAREALEAYRTTVGELGPRQPRELMTARPAGRSIAIDTVEPARRIVRRFVSSAMSLGALSPEAHQALTIGMARLGGSANSGEGGEDPAWYQPSADGDRRDAGIKQVASARFGVTAEYLSRAEQLEIKIAQGSKPGEGGQLPGKKATAFIAGLRRGQPGMTMISPPPHHDIYSIEDLAQLISDLRAINPTARIGVKLVAGAGIGTIAAGVAKAHADYIMVSGHAGGTGASPLSSIKHAGLPWELGLAEVHQVLVRNRLRDRVTLRTDGGLQTGRDVVMAAILGAEEFGFGTSALVSLGCDMARQCHLDTCPTGIATQRPELRAKFTGTPEQVVTFFTALAEDVRAELARLGLARLGESVGRTDLLALIDRPALELEPILRAPVVPMRGAARAPRDRPLVERAASGPPGFEQRHLDEVLRSVAAGRPVVVSERVTTADRTIGARLAGALSRREEPRQLPHVTYRLSGSAGQSLGAFAVGGMRIEVTGEANDYVGKGLSGATIVVRPERDEDATHAIAGNVCLYGATAGVLHLVGRAGMRFAVRNSGARAVVEGIGAHGCEYMTGGTIVVLGEVGPNFGAGMTGGRAYVYDASRSATKRLNIDSVRGRRLADDGERAALRELVAAHSGERSRLAASLLRDWERSVKRFVAIEPREVAVPLAVSPPLEGARLAAGR